MQAAMREMFGSKKFLATLALVLLFVVQAVLAHFKVDLPDSVMTAAKQALMVYVGAQGLADLGKSGFAQTMTKILAAAAAPKDAPKA